MKYAIVGAGGMARELREILIDMGASIEDIEFFVDSQYLGGELRAKDLSAIDSKNHRVFLASGDSSTREKWHRQLETTIAAFETVVHPTALVGSSVSLGQGGLVSAQCHLTCDIQIGDFSQLNLQTTISHDCVIGNFFTTAPKVSVPGNVTIGNHVTFGTGATVLPGISICNHVIVGAGAVVTKDITEPGTYVGVPAKRIS